MKHELPVGYRIYGLVKLLLLPAGTVLIATGSVAVGLALLGLAVVDMAVISPILIARHERRERVERPNP